MLDRRRFIAYIPAAAATFCTMIGLAQTSAKAAEYRGVGAIETLMRGHGLLLRCMIVYDVLRERLGSGKEVDPSLVLNTTAVIHNYLQGFHEKMEETYLFKPMEKANIDFSSIQELKVQHGTGFELGHRITELAKAGKLGPELSHNLDAFGRMYRYHAAWEDTVIFPSFDSMEKKAELAELSQTFESEERKILGHTGFASFVTDIADVEKQLHIYDLSSWTPQL